jgi:hypothetical protein
MRHRDMMAYEAPKDSVCTGLQAIRATCLVANPVKRMYGLDAELSADAPLSYVAEPVG